MKIYITTLGRVDQQRTLMNLPGALRRQVIMVVQDHEWAEHEEEWRGVVGEVRALPPHIRTLGPTRREVFGWREDQKIVLLDDDLDFYTRRDADDWRLLPPTRAETHGIFEEIEDALDLFYHVSVSGREGNNRVVDYCAMNTRYMRLLAYRTDMPGEVEHGRVDGMSDFDVNLQLLKLGYPSLVFFRHAQGQKGTQTPGGCAIDRTHEKHEAEIDKMVEWHYPYVEKVWKQNKTGGDFGTRPEVKVAWKQAFFDSFTPVDSEGIVSESDPQEEEDDDESDTRE